MMQFNVESRSPVNAFCEVLGKTKTPFVRVLKRVGLGRRVFWEITNNWLCLRYDSFNKVFSNKQNGVTSKGIRFASLVARSKKFQWCVVRVIEIYKCTNKFILNYSHCHPPPYSWSYTYPTRTIIPRSSPRRYTLPLSLRMYPREF